MEVQEVLRKVGDPDHGVAAKAVLVGVFLLEGLEAGEVGRGEGLPELRRVGEEGGDSGRVVLGVHHTFRRVARVGGLDGGA